MKHVGLRLSKIELLDLIRCCLALILIDLGENYRIVLKYRRDRYLYLS